jgi:hypothetical protein
MKPITKGVFFGTLSAGFAFAATFVTWNFDRWRWEARGFVLCGPIDDGWFAASVASLVAYIVVFTPVLWFSRRESR